MRAMLLQEPERLVEIELPARPPADGEVLLRIDACSICGSDLEGYHGWHPTMTLPRVMGHEVASTVVELGAGVSDLKPGDRVAGTGVTSCGECGACRAGDRRECESPLSPGFAAQGAYAEYMTVLPTDLTRVPDGVTSIEAAVAQPAAIANHAVSTRANVQAGEVVLIQGCGPIGLCAMVLAKLRGATVISTDIVDYRCEMARALGVDLALNDHRDDVLATVMEMTSGRGVDKVIECVGSDQDETIPEAVRAVKRRGLVTVVGSFAQDKATLPIINFKFKEKAIIGSQSMPEGYGPIFDLILSGKIDLNRLVSHRLPLERLAHGLRLMDTKEDEVMKVVIEPNGPTA